MTAKPERRLRVCGSFGSLIHTRWKRLKLMEEKKKGSGSSEKKNNGGKKVVYSLEEKN